MKAIELSDGLGTYLYNQVYTYLHNDTILRMYQISIYSMFNESADDRKVGSFSEISSMTLRDLSSVLCRYSLRNFHVITLNSD